MKLRLALTVVTLACAGCAPGKVQKPEQTVASSNMDYPVDRLFTDEKGNTLYRFEDGPRIIYYISGPNNARVIHQSVPPPPDPPMILEPSYGPNQNLVMKTNGKGGKGGGKK